MKPVLLLCAIFALASANLRAAEPIEGAFGFTFGQEYRPTTPLLAHAANGFSDVYKVEPPAPNPAFEAVYVKITPQTHLIYEIIGVGRKLDGDEAVRNEQGIKAYLQAKYGNGPNPFPNDAIAQEKAAISFLMARAGDEITTSLAYRNFELYKQANDEAHALRAEQDATRARQLLKAFDSTGL